MSSVAISVLYVVIAVDLLSTLGIAVSTAGRAGGRSRCGPGLRRPAGRPGPARWFLRHHREGSMALGDLVVLTVTGATEARGTVEDVTLRVTRLRNIDGEVFNVPNGQIVKTQNLSKDWARAVVDVPLPLGTDLVHVSGS